ncbi:Uncharacterised protein [Shewanella putrefaciens]|nr:Uncharacterised protein [Shewanella putrefaciens]
MVLNGVSILLVEDDPVFRQLSPRSFLGVALM